MNLHLDKDLFGEMIDTLNARTGNIIGRELNYGKC